MPQHLWRTLDPVRVCEVCHAVQAHAGQRWTPPVNHICPGDPDDDGGRRLPLMPSRGPRILEECG